MEQVDRVFSQYSNIPVHKKDEMNGAYSINLEGEEGRLSL